MKKEEKNAETINRLRFNQSTQIKFINGMNEGWRPEWMNL